MIREDLMPYEIKTSTKDSKKQWCVYNTDTGENKGCSDTLEEATSHMRLLYGIESGMKPRKS